MTVRRPIGTRSRLAVAAAVTSLALVALAGCSGGAAGPDSPAPGGAGTTSGTASGGDGSGKLVVAMTAANVPSTDTPPTEGGEGFRFVGYQLYDPLVGWDLSSEDELATLAPSLATDWKVDDADTTRWTFTLRQGVKFHDGTDWNADAAIFQFDRIMNKDFEYYNQTDAAASASYVSTIAGYAKVDDYTIEITTKAPTSSLPYSMTSLLFPSPTAVKAEGDGYADAPVGTGPFVFESKSAESLLLKRNESYWNTPAKISELELKPVPDAAARLAALESGEVNWAEVPPPDALAQLESEGFTLHHNFIPFVWPWVLNEQKAPFDDVKVRQAINYGIDRQAMIDAILGGTATPATGPVYQGHPWYDDSATTYDYDPEKAKQLLAEAGYPNGVEIHVLAPQSGSGNMLPQPMNELLQQQLAAIGVTVDLQFIEWNTMRTTYRSGFPDGVDALQYAWTTATPDWIIQFFESDMTPPKGLNPGGYSNPKVDDLLQAAKQEFDPAKRDADLQQAIGLVQDDAPWLWVVHDLNSRVTAKGVGNVVMAQASYVDLTKVTVDQP